MAFTFTDILMSNIKREVEAFIHLLNTTFNIKILQINWSEPEWNDSDGYDVWLESVILKENQVNHKIEVNDDSYIIDDEYEYGLCNYSLDKYQLSDLIQNKAAMYKFIYKQIKTVDKGLLLLVSNAKSTENKYYINYNDEKE